MLTKNITIKNIDIDANYNNNYSSLSPLKEILPFFTKIKLLKEFLSIFLLDFNIGSIELILSILFGIFLYLLIISLIRSNITYELTRPELQVFTIFSILSLQFFLSFIFYDCGIKVLMRKNN